jgi:hypothetical protein
MNEAAPMEAVPIEAPMEEAIEAAPMAQWISL